MGNDVEEVRGLKAATDPFLWTDPEEHGQRQQEPGHSSVCLPTRTSPIWVSLHNLQNNWLNVVLLILLGFRSTDISSSAAVSLFTSMHVLCVHESTQELKQQE